MSGRLSIRWFLGSYAVIASVLTGIYLPPTSLTLLEAILLASRPPAVVLLYRLETTDPDADVTWEQVDDVE